MRKCGTCNACCTLLAVPAVDTPSFTRCEHLKAGRSTRCCSLGDEARPEACRAFACGWLLGIGANKDRPDRSGVMITSSFDPEDQRHQVQAYQTRPGVWTRRAMELLNRIAEKAVVIHVEEETRTILGGPRKDVEAMHAKIQTELKRLREEGR